MSKFKNMPVVLIVAIILSCSTNDDTANSFHIANGFSFSVVDEAGRDLLDPDTPGHLKEENIALFYFENNKKKEMFTTNLDYPKHFRIRQRNDKYIIDIMPPLDEKQNPMVTLIQWNDDNVDTLETESLFNNNSIVNKRIWFNGDLIWEREDNTEKYLEIIK